MDAGRELIEQSRSHPYILLLSILTDAGGNLDVGGIVDRTGYAASTVMSALLWMRKHELVCGGGGQYHATPRGRQMTALARH